jgi:hypothetical protein
MREGIARVGDKPIARSSHHYQRPEGQVGVFYGLSGKLVNALADYPAAGRTAVFVDMGYWGRKTGGRYLGYHKLTVNSRHPTAYFQRQKHSASRFLHFGVKIEPWRTSGQSIVVAGMGPKGNRAEGYGPQGWEKEIIPLLRQHTRRPILYRPMPNSEGSKPILGSTMIDKDQPLREALADAWALVAHHSNAAVEGLVMGVPAFVVEGAALPMACADFTRIEHPRRPGNRRQWLADLGWTQFSVAEMAEGLAWRHLKDEGLVP